MGDSSHLWEVNAQLLSSWFDASAKADWSADVPLAEVDHALSTLSTEVVGYSYARRPIHAIRLGQGPVRVAAWARMHGNEPTATKAMLDFVHWLHATEEGKEALKSVSLLLIPVLNPDGADAYTRRNAQGIDINRDFHAFQSPEARLLRDALVEFKPHLALNLHDQRSLFGAGRSGKPASVAFLAPSVSPARAITAQREQAMGVISSWLPALTEVLDSPGMARFSDEYYPTAVGEWAQKNLCPTILIEAGHCPGDRHRTLARKATFLCLAMACTFQKDRQELAQPYLDLPLNEQNFVDLKIPGLTFALQGGDAFQCDLGFRFAAGRPTAAPKLTLEEVGDLHFVFAHAQAPEPEAVFQWNPFEMVGKALEELTGLSAEVGAHYFGIH